MKFLKNQENFNKIFAMTLSSTFIIVITNGVIFYAETRNILSDLKDEQTKRDKYFNLKYLFLYFMIVFITCLFTYIFLYRLFGIL